jgi:hypothetical protein
MPRCTQFFACIETKSYARTATRTDSATRRARRERRRSAWEDASCLPAAVLDHIATPTIVTASRADFHRPASILITQFIADDQGNREGLDGLRWGVEPICTQLSELGVPIAPQIYTTSSIISRVVARSATVSSKTTSKRSTAPTTTFTARKVWLALNGKASRWPDAPWSG